MISVERLSLRLPPGFAARAPAIAREVAGRLASLASLGSVSLERVIAAPVRVGEGASDGEVANAVLTAVLDGARRAEGSAC
jgi:hypothetical protein